MSHKDKLTVEVFQEIDSSDAGIGDVHDGIEHINRITDNIEIIRDTRKIKLGNEHIIAQNIRWQGVESPADFTVTVTDKLIANDGHEVRGYAQTPYHAVISTRYPQPNVTTAHEMGHLLNLRYPEAPHATDPAVQMHCRDEQCLMIGQISTKEVEVPIQRHGIMHILEACGLVPELYTYETRVATEAFCPPCEQQLARRAFFLLRHKQGHFTPAIWR